jgi:thiamine-monophosphate kinase
MSGEFERITRFFDRGAERLRGSLASTALLGIGDDCALLSPLSQTQAGTLCAISTDMLVAGQHFWPDVDPASLGHKALAVNLSDLAAMGARPRAFTLALALGDRNDDAWLEAFCQGLFALAAETACELIGGDTTRGPLCICITVIGDVDPRHCLRRDRARPGDHIWVSGELGAAAYALRHPGLSRSADERLLRPKPRLALGTALIRHSSCAIDLSDGLLGDLRHILERSQVGALIQAECIPVHPALRDLSLPEQRALALQGGDDYELLFTASPDACEALHALSATLGLALTKIGVITEDRARDVVDASGQSLGLHFEGFDHFATH